LARASHDEFAQSVGVNPGTVLTDSIVSFSVPLDDPGQASCIVPVIKSANAPVGCGSTSAPAQPISQAPAQPAQAVAAVVQNPPPVVQPANPQPPEVLNALGAVEPTKQQEVANVLDRLTQDVSLVNSLSAVLSTGDPIGLPTSAFTSAKQICDDIQPVGTDLYGPTCSLDFGQGMCPIDLQGNQITDAASFCYMAEMCQVYCGYTEPASDAVRESLFWGLYAQLKQNYQDRVQGACRNVADYDAQIAAGQRPY